MRHVLLAALGALAAWAAPASMGGHPATGPGADRQESPLPAGRLVFRASSAEFRPDRTFVIESVLEGMGSVTATGTWKTEADVVYFTGYDTDPGNALLKQASIPLSACDTAGHYRYVVAGTQVRFSLLADACVPRRLFLDGTLLSGDLAVTVEKRSVDVQGEQADHEQI